MHIEAGLHRHYGITIQILLYMYEYISVCMKKVTLTIDEVLWDEFCRKVDSEDPNGKGNRSATIVRLIRKYLSGRGK